MKVYHQFNEFTQYVMINKKKSIIYNYKLLYILLNQFEKYHQYIQLTMISYNLNKNNKNK